MEEGTNVYLRMLMTLSRVGSLVLRNLWWFTLERDGTLYCRLPTSLSEEDIYGVEIAI